MKSNCHNRRHKKGQAFLELIIASVILSAGLVAAFITTTSSLREASNSAIMSAADAWLENEAQVMEVATPATLTTLGYISTGTSSSVTFGYTASSGTISADSRFAGTITRTYNASSSSGTAYTPANYLVSLSFTIQGSNGAITTTKSRTVYRGQ